MSLEAGELADQATAAYEAGEIDRAIERFTAARTAYESAGQVGPAAEMANSLSVVLLKAGRAEEALSAVQGTPEVFSELEDTRRTALATGNLAAALEACGQLERAESAYREAAAQFESVDDQEARTHTLTALSQLQLRQNRPLEAASTLSATQPDRSIRDRLLKSLLQLPSRLLRS